MTHAKLVLSYVVAIALITFVPRATAQSECAPFGGTIYGWHNVDNAWHGVGHFTFGKKILHATVDDPNTSFSDMGDIWLGTEEARFTFAKGDEVTLMTSFVTEHQTDPGGSTGIYHVNETGYFARGTGRFKHAWGRFNLQGPFGPSVALPVRIKPGPNDGWFWIGQYSGTICGVKDIGNNED